MSLDWRIMSRIYAILDCPEHNAVLSPEPLRSERSKSRDTPIGGPSEGHARRTTKLDDKKGADCSAPSSHEGRWSVDQLNE